MKHGILLMDGIMGFCPDKIITKDGRYSILDFLNSNWYQEEYKFVKLEPQKVVNFINDFPGLFTTDDFFDAHYWISRGDVESQEFKDNFQKMWMMIREIEKCRKCEVKCE